MPVVTPSNKKPNYYMASQSSYDPWGYISDNGKRPYTDLNSFEDWWGKNSGGIGAAWEAKQQKYLRSRDALREQLPASTWAGSKWETRYNDQRQGLDALLARLQAGPTAQDTTDAMGQVAAMYGYSPASFTGIQQALPDMMNASNVMTNAADITGELANTAFGQEQAKAMRVAQRQATEAVGKKLEGIFAGGGGLQGFQAAYDLTAQLSNQAIQQQSQYNLAMFDRALSQINAENGYYKDLVDRGAIAGQDYLKFRWDQMQTAYQDMMVAMDQTVRNWTDITEEDTRIIQNQINALTEQMVADLGGYSNVQEYLTSLYNQLSQPLIDADAARRDEEERNTLGYKLTHLF